MEEKKCIMTYETQKSLTCYLYLIGHVSLCDQPPSKKWSRSHPYMLHYFLRHMSTLGWHMLFSLIHLCYVRSSSKTIGCLTILLIWFSFLNNVATKARECVVSVHTIHALVNILKRPLCILCIKENIWCS
mgnify:CR=1 FL=1